MVDVVQVAHILVVEDVKVIVKEVVIQLAKELQSLHHHVRIVRQPVKVVVIVAVAQLVKELQNHHLVHLVQIAVVAAVQVLVALDVLVDVLAVVAQGVLIRAKLDAENFAIGVVGEVATIAVQVIV